MLMHNAGFTDYDEAKLMLVEYGSVKKALDKYTHHNSI